MALKEFLRKIFREEQKDETEILELPLNKLVSHLTKEQEKIQEESKDIKKKLDVFLVQFISALNSHQNSLKSVNIDSRKEDERIKLIVKENLKHYASYLENLTDELEKIEEQSLKDFLQKAYRAIHNFEAVSRSSFEKATILTGELGKIRQEIRNFISQLDSTVSENKKLFDRENVIEEIKRIIQEKEKLKNATDEIKKQMQKTEQKQEELKLEINIKKSEIEKLKSSSEYQKELREKAKYEQEKLQFNQEIARLKEKIDLKFLAKYFHQDVKKSKIINGYLTNFLETLEHDENLELESMAMEAKKIEINLKEIKLRHKTLFQPLFLLIEEKINFLEKEVKNLESNLFLAGEEKDKYEKALSKLEEKTKESEGDIKEKAKGLGVAVA